MTSVSRYIPPSLLIDWGKMLLRSLNDLRDPSPVSFVTRSGVYLARPESSKPGVAKVIAELALSCFEEALRGDPRLSEAYYQRGRAFECLGDYRRAYLCFENALSLFPLESRFKRRCCEIFQERSEINFSEVRLHAPVDNIQDLFRSSFVFERMEACFLFLYRPDLREGAKEMLTSCAGRKLFGYYLPFMGDSDKRVKMAARRTLLILGME